MTHLTQLMKIAAHPGHFFQPLVEKPGKAIVVERHKLMPDVTAWFYVCAHRKLGAPKLFQHLSDKDPAHHPCYKCHARHQLMIGQGGDDDDDDDDDMDVEPEKKSVRKRRYGRDPFEAVPRQKSKIEVTPKALKKIGKLVNVNLPLVISSDDEKKLLKLEKMHYKINELAELHGNRVSSISYEYRALEVMEIDERMKIYKTVLLNLEKLDYFHQRYPKVEFRHGQLNHLLEIYSPNYYTKIPRELTTVEPLFQIDIVKEDINRLIDGIYIESINTGIYKLELPEMPFVPVTKASSRISESKRKQYLELLVKHADTLWRTLINLSAGIKSKTEQQKPAYSESESMMKYVFDPSSKSYMGRYYNCHNIITYEDARRKVREIFTQHSEVRKNVKNKEHFLIFLAALIDDEDDKEFIMDDEGRSELYSARIPLFYLEEGNDDSSKYYISILNTGRALELQSNMAIHSDIYFAMRRFLNKTGRVELSKIKNRYDTENDIMSISVKYIDSTMDTLNAFLFIAAKAAEMRDECIVALPIDKTNRLYGRIGIDVDYQKGKWLKDLFRDIDMLETPEYMKFFGHIPDTFMPIIRLDIQSQKTALFSERVYFNTCKMEYDNVVRMIGILQAANPLYKKIAYIDLDRTKEKKAELEAALSNEAISILIIHNEGHAKVAAKSSIENNLFYADPFMQSIDPDESKWITELHWNPIFVPRQKDQPHELSCHLISLMRAIMCLMLGWEKGFLMTYDYGRNPDFLDYPVLIANLVFWVIYEHPQQIQIPNVKSIDKKAK